MPYPVKPTFQAENNLHADTIFIKSLAFDLITKDAKTTFMDQLAVIKGTLGIKIKNSSAILPS